MEKQQPNSDECFAFCPILKSGTCIYLNCPDTSLVCCTICKKSDRCINHALFSDNKIYCIGCYDDKESFENTGGTEKALYDLCAITIKNSTREIIVDDKIYKYQITFEDPINQWEMEIDILDYHMFVDIPNGILILILLSN